MSKNPANRNALGHVKEGLKNIPRVYKALYNAPMTDKPNAPGKGVGRTIKDNVKFMVQGPTKKVVLTPEQKAKSNERRVAVGVMGALSPTPLGPVGAFALGVKKSIADQKRAQGLTNPKANPKPAPKVTAPKATPPKATKPTTAPKPQLTPDAKAKLLKKNLNTAFPGLNMK